jgi:hypothetical protein
MIFARRKQKERGGILLAVLLSSLILGIGLASYLQYTSTQTRAIMRSQAWNSAIPVAEAGIEEALAHINDSVIGTNWTLNGWTVVSNEFQKAGKVDAGRYLARISPDKLPIITCVGYTSDRTTNELVRTVQVTTSRFGTGLKGLITKKDLTMNGGTMIDSFDSQDARYSTSGRYDAAKHKDGGYAASVFGNLTGETVYGSVGTGPTGIATGTVGDFSWTRSNNGIEPGHYANDVNLSFPEVQPPFDGGAASPVSGSVSVTNYSYWSTMVTTTNIPNPPPTTPITTNLNGTITATSYPTGVPVWMITTNTTHTRTKADPTPGTYLNLVIQGAWNEYDLITSYSYPARTYTYSTMTTNVSVTSDRYDYVLNGDRYQMSDLSLSGGQKVMVVGTNVTLYIKGGLSMTGNSQIEIAPGASLTVYVGGDVKLAGNGILNYTTDASHFSLFGLPSNQNIAISGNAAFTGVIYAPEAALSMNGGGNNNYDVVGAIVAKTANLHGHFQFHYDEALGRAKILSKYSVASWREL